MKVAALALLLALLAACGGSYQPSSDEVQRADQERILQEGTAQTGMPAITNFRERKQLKHILELRDKEGVVTYTYLFSEMTGKLTFLCDSIGYGLPAATQFTNPEKTERHMNYGMVTLPQADPNGLFSPTSAEGTWVMCSDPTKEGKASVVYVEPRVVTLPYKPAAAKP